MHSRVVRSSHAPPRQRDDRFAPKPITGVAPGGIAAGAPREADRLASLEFRSDERALGGWRRPIDAPVTIRNFPPGLAGVTLRCPMPMAVVRSA
jgi:hypothetical protein